jgi:hypothetical protein
MARRVYGIGLVLLSLAIGGTGCKPKPGGRCGPSQVACFDKGTALFCLDGKFTEMSCGGPAGCVQSGKQVDCDNTLANKGEGCAEQEDLACTADKKNELRCRGNKFVVASTCRGPTGCYFTGNKLHCDTDVADLTDPCEDKDDLACSLDKKSLYKCDGATYKVESACKGPKGCQIEGTSVKCDHHLADLNDVCHVDGNFACAMDKKTLLVCKGNKFHKEKGCKNGCSFAEKGDTTEFDCP